MAKMMLVVRIDPDDPSTEMVCKSEIPSDELVGVGVDLNWVSSVYLIPMMASITAEIRAKRLVVGKNTAEVEN